MRSSGVADLGRLPRVLETERVPCLLGITVHFLRFSCLTSTDLMSIIVADMASFMEVNCSWLYQNPSSPRPNWRC